MEHFFQKNASLIAGALACILAVSFLFDRGLSIGLSLLVILSGATFLVLEKLGLKDKKIYWLFLIVAVIHLVTTLFMYYANFHPFGGGIGDSFGYHRSAVQAASFFHQGNFSIKEIVLKYPDFYTGHIYPIIIGILYALTMPSQIIGLMLNVWLAALTVIFAYLIVLEISPLEPIYKKMAFIVGLIIAIYPSYIFNSGLLLKDALEIGFIILGLLFLIKTVKRFSWGNFLVLYIVIFCATHFRFYNGYALILTFLPSWFLFSNVAFKKRMQYGLIFIIILGFIPQFAFNQGYYGINSLRDFFNAGQLAYYREVAWNPAYNLPTPTAATPTAATPTAATPTAATPTASITTTPIITSITIKPTPIPSPVVSVSPVLPTTEPVADAGFGSSFLVKSGPLGYAESFMYVLLGPFPWQIRYLRQAFALVETIPWYLLLFFVIDGIILVARKRVKLAVPLLIFSLIMMVVIAIFDKNFGLIVRIRIPVFMSLLCVAALSPIGAKYVNAIWQKLYGKS